MNKPNAIIVGAGIGGLGTAALLAKEGYQVTVYEKNEGPGGRGSVWEEAGYTFDLGPSWYLMRDVFNRFFAEFGKVDTDFFEVIRLDPSYRIYFAPNDYVDISSDLHTNIALFDSFEKNGGAKLQKYLQASQKLYESTVHQLLYRNIDSPLDFFKIPGFASMARHIPLWGSLDQHVKASFDSPRARSILEYSTVFLGGDPQNTPALYSLMSHLDFNQGVWYPKGGIGALMRAIEWVGKSQGVSYYYNSPVQKILTQNQRAIGVEVQGEKHFAELVIVNADLHHTQSTLLEPSTRTYNANYWRKATIAPSAFLLYLGLDKKINALAHHTLSFDHDWMRHFRDIFTHPKWPEHPSYYINCPSVTQAGLAPAGGENLFILVPVAAGLEDSDNLRQTYATKIITHVEHLLGESITPHIKLQRIFAHREFISRYNSYKGTALGLAHVLTQSAFLRPSNKSKKITNLYYVGQYTQPGIGMPICLISAHLVRDRIKKDYK
jgi:phytoene desaturase